MILMILALTERIYGNKDKFMNSISLLIVILVAGILIGNTWRESRKQYMNHIRNFNFALSNAALVSDNEVNKYMRMQQSIPQGETVFTKLSKPFLLDFSRNRILVIADSPGEVSPPPGMPVFKGYEVLADYLTSKSLRYVAYSYNDKSVTPNMSYLRDFLTPKAYHLDRTCAQCKIDFHDKHDAAQGYEKNNL